MKKQHTLKLIEGKFQQSDAKEILKNIYSAKISYHQMKNFSSLERLGTPDKIAAKKIPFLKKEISKLEKILAKAKEKNLNLIITSEINITLQDE